jgi:hypothetical protein
MNLTSRTQRIELLLHERQLLALDHANPRMAIECCDGALWVTASGDVQDHVLYAGQRYVPRKNSKVVIEALKDASLDIQENNLSNNTFLPPILFRAIRGQEAR